MSIFFDFDVGTTGRRFRRAVDTDKYNIECFWNRKETEKLFGTVDVGSLIELSTLSICMIDENKDVVGFVAFCDHPNVPGIDAADWEMWIRNMFQKYYLSRNTLFVHFMCTTDTVAEFFLEEALTSVFLNDFYLLNVIIMVPPDCPDDVILKYQTFKKRNIYKYYARREDDSEKAFHYIYAAMRQDFCAKLRTRRAVEEDNDDIVEILDRTCPRLRKLYGDYYISEIVGRHPNSHRKVIVADYQERAIAVMCLNSDINYTKLQAVYELRPYYGLMKATPLEKEQNKRRNVLLTTFGEPIMLGHCSPFEQYTKPECMESSTIPPVRDRKATTQSSKVNFKRTAAMRHSMELIIRREQPSDDYSDKIYMQSPNPSINTDFSVADYLLEDDPFDYEIINIDTNLLTIPEVLSTGFMKPIESINKCKSTPNTNRGAKGKKSTSKPFETDEIDKEIYHGCPNAFMIELYGLREDVDDRCGFDLLEAAFEIMKDYDYCIIRVPSADKSIPLLQHFCFVPIKSHICCNYSLYVAHRCSVLGKLRVRKVEYIDIPEISRLLQNLEGKEILWTIENSITTTKQHLAYVFMSGLSVVGIGILEPPEQTHFLRAKYNIDDYHNHKYHLKGQGTNTGFEMLKVALAYSVFEVHYRYFTREMMRLSDSSALVWLTGYRNKWVAHKANSLASAMVPLIPRQTEIDSTAVPELKKIDALSRNVMAFSIWFISKKLTSLPKIYVGTRIVVVGASRTAMAFLNTLLFSDSSTYITFTNVTLISTKGLPYVRNSKPLAAMMFPRQYFTSDKYLKSTPYTYYVNIVHGTMMEINKQEKYITLENDKKYYYDLLFLLCGLQYQHPNYLKSFTERDENIKSASLPKYIRVDVPYQNQMETQLSNECPDNVFIINNITEAHKALKFVKQIIYGQDDYKIIVYGATIHAYCCLATLLELNVPTKHIVFVEPFPPEDPEETRVPVFCNVNVDQTVREMLENLHVTVYRSYYFESWTLASNNRVSHVNVISYFKMLRLECSAFFYYGKRGVNTQAFIAVNKCGMAYDSGILINGRFRTKDSAIYAAGTASAYQRQYFAQSLHHKYYDSYEIGQKLGAQIRDQLDPLFTEKSPQSKSSEIFPSQFNTNHATMNDARPNQNINNSTSETASQPGSNSDKFVEEMPDLKKPIVIYCNLPGGLQYLEVRSPAKKIPHSYIQSLHYNGIVMETFKGGYFKLHFNNDMIVDGITCLTPEKYSLEMFRHIYGMSAVVLNNVHLKYTANKIDDFYEFFRSSWAFFLYHDHADELFAMVKELLPKGQCKGVNLREALCSVKETISGPYFRNDFNSEIRSNVEKSPHIAAIADYVIEWVSENEILLPMYLQPWQKTEYDLDLERNPGFKKKKTNISKLISMIL